MVSGESAEGTGGGCGHGIDRKRTVDGMGTRRRGKVVAGGERW